MIVFSGLARRVNDTPTETGAAGRPSRTPWARLMVSLLRALPMIGHPT